MAMQSFTDTLGPNAKQEDFAGLDRRRVTGSTGGADVALNTRRDDGSLRGLPMPADLSTHPGAPRGLEYHVQVDGTPVRLLFAGDAVLSDDGLDADRRTFVNADGNTERCLTWDGREFSLAGVHKVKGAQGGPEGQYTYFLDTGLGTVPDGGEDGGDDGGVTAGIFTIGESVIGGPDVIG